MGDATQYGDELNLSRKDYDNDAKSKGAKKSCRESGQDFLYIIMNHFLFILVLNYRHFIETPPDYASQGRRSTKSSTCWCRY
jgi:hypothetical protein